MEGPGPEQEKRVNREGVCKKTQKLEPRSGPSEDQPAGARLGKPCGALLHLGMHQVKLHLKRAHSTGKEA